jgi:dipeptidyl aminopeptidase/acylaminoacyl peptidase
MAGMIPDDIGQLVTPGDPRLSPDGRSVAFTISTVDLKDNRYHSQVWLAAVDGSAPPSRLTSGDGNEIRPRWSPRGDAVAFVWHSVDDEDETHQVRVAWSVSAAAAAPPDRVGEVASWPQAIEELAWSPDGRRVAFVARLRDEAHYGTKKSRDRPPRRLNRLFNRLDSEGWVADRVKQLFVVAADGSSPPQPVTEGPFQLEGLAWSPDGTRLAFTSGRHDDWDLDLATDVFITELPDPGAAPRAPRRLTGGGAGFFSPSWSPDGRRLAVYYGGDPWSEPRHSQVGVLDVDSGQLELLTTELDRQCAPYPTMREPVWAGDGVLFRVEDGGNTHLYRSHPLAPVVTGDREVASFDAASGTMAFVGSTPTATSELFVVASDTGEERQLTRLGAPFTAATELVAPVAFWATAPDGNQVPAWAMAPVGARPGVRYPTLLNIHGGPFTQYGNRFFDEFQLQGAPVSRSSTPTRGARRARRRHRLGPSGGRKRTRTRARGGAASTTTT